MIGILDCEERPLSDSQDSSSFSDPPLSSLRPIVNSSKPVSYQTPLSFMPGSIQARRRLFRRGNSGECSVDGVHYPGDMLLLAARARGWLWNCPLRIIRRCSFVSGRLFPSQLELVVRFRLPRGVVAKVPGLSRSYRVIVQWIDVDDEGCAQQIHNRVRVCFAVCRSLGYTPVSSPGRIFGATCAKQNLEAQRSEETFPSADRRARFLRSSSGRSKLTSVAAVDWPNGQDSTNAKGDSNPGRPRDPITGLEHIQLTAEQFDCSLSCTAPCWWLCACSAQRLVRFSVERTKFRSCSGSKLQRDKNCTKLCAQFPNKQKPADWELAFTPISSKHQSHRYNS